MAQELRFDGKVVVVTGAGHGLGRSHALAFARRGAKVVVNDLGGTHTGEGKSSAVADAVVEEIKAAGGEAVANYDSVEDGDKIVKTAIDAFGRIDVLVNNAGILRDVSFQKMTEQEWDLVYRVHVKGAFRCTHAAWPYMREQKYGRIVFTTSAAGIYGNFGQANYASAKLALVGLANTLAIEGRKYNVIVNTIAPVAASRMTETVLPPNLLDALKPEYVTALVLLLCHESHDDGGGVYEVGGGFYGRLRWERARGKLYRIGRLVSPEDLREAWKDITNFAQSTHPASIAESLDPILKNVERGPSKGGNQYIDVDEALGYEFPEMRSAYDERDLAMYALSVGAAASPTDDRELQFVYELHGNGFLPLPTYGVVPAINCMLTLSKEGKSAPGLKYGLDRVLHGEQYLELVRPLPPRQKLTHKARIKDIFDKGADGGKKGGAIVITAIDSYDEDGDLLIRNEITTFVRGAGGWGGDRGPSADVNVPPERAPDATVEQKTHENQALLYRLSGDWNPLHADPGFAKAFGFERPILHGLCTLGYAARHVLKTFAKDGDPRYFKSIKVRFADPVFPGETLVTEMWKESGTRILFRVKVKERDKVVLSNAAVELFSQLPKPKEKKAAASGVAVAAEVVPNSADVFAGIRAMLARSGADAVAAVKTVFAFKLKNPDSVWTLDLKNGNGAVLQGEPIPAECTFEIAEADFMDMVLGKADAMKLFTTGKLKISGNVMASQKLAPVLKKVDPADVTAALKERSRGGGAAAAPVGGAVTAAPPAGRTATAPAIFDALSKRIAGNPGLVKEVGAVIEFRVRDPEGVWTVDLKNGAGGVMSGGGKGADTILTLSDADLLALANGTASAQALFQQGRLRVDGEVAPARRLGFLTKLA
jgi:3-hydroxyacyl-CoA dehydrogenase/3a,7a,12a-trihydroxy-5b-cholest-24-enoyl-CoA hydratase